MGKAAVASNLAMRFYISDGWTKEELDECCVQGCFDNNWPDDANPYYILNRQGSYDVEKLLAKISKIRRAFPEQHDLTDRELLEQQNW